MVISKDKFPKFNKFLDNSEWLNDMLIHKSNRLLFEIFQLGIQYRNHMEEGQFSIGNYQIVSFFFDEIYNFS